MSPNLETSRADLHAVLDVKDFGPPAGPRLWAVPLVLACERMDAWGGAQPPKWDLGGKARGGSSSPREVEDRLEARRLMNQIARDASRLPLLVVQIEFTVGLAVVGEGRFVYRLNCVRSRVSAALQGIVEVDGKGLERLTRDLVSLVARYTRPVDESKLPKDDPDCLSCARTMFRKGQKLGGKSEPVYEKAKKHKLCRFCYDFSGGNQDAWPPIEMCHIRLEQGPRAAAAWLSRRSQGAA